MPNIYFNRLPRLVVCVTLSQPLQNTADVKSASTDATTAKITAIGSAVAVAIGAIFLGITQIAPYFVAKPGPIQVVNCPCAEKQAKPVLVDPAILTDDQKAKIKTNGPK